MSILTDSLEKWLGDTLREGVTANISGLFDKVNDKVSVAAGEAGTSPESWNPGIYSLIRGLSEDVIMPLAGVVLAFVMTVELITMVSEKNNLRDFDTFIFFKWIFKSAAAVLIVSNTWPIISAVFQLSGRAVNSASSLISGNLTLGDAGLAALLSSLENMGAGELLGLWLETAFAGLAADVLSVLIFVIAYGRMIEIYLMVSLAPLPMASLFAGHGANIGGGYIKSVMALAFQGFLIMVCIGIYAALIGHIPVSGDISGAVWTSLGYTFLLCFALFETGNLSKAIFRG